MTTAIQLTECPGFTFLVEGEWDECGRVVTVQSATGPDGQPLSEADLTALTEDLADAIHEVAEERLEQLEALLDTPDVEPVDPAWEAEEEQRVGEGEGEGLGHQVFVDGIARLLRADLDES